MITKFKLFEKKLCGDSDKEPEVREPKGNEPISNTTEIIAKESTLKSKKKMKKINL